MGVLHEQNSGGGSPMARVSVCWGNRRKKNYAELTLEEILMKKKLDGGKRGEFLEERRDPQQRQEKKGKKLCRLQGVPWVLLGGQNEWEKWGLKKEGLQGKKNIPIEKRFGQSRESRQSPIFRPRREKKEGGRLQVGGTRGMTAHEKEGSGISPTVDRNEKHYNILPATASWGNRI